MRRSNTASLMPEAALFSSSLPTGEERAQRALPNIRPQRRFLDDNRGVNPIARVLLAGALLPSNKSSPFSELSICLHLIEEIYRIVRAAWKEDLIIGPPKTHGAFSGGNWLPFSHYVSLPDQEELSKTWSLAHVGNVSFPPPRGININMMPILLNSPNNSSIPKEYRHYADIIDKCCWFQNNDAIGTAYLTIHESRVEMEESQRRAGIHTEGFFSSAPGPLWHPWGMYMGNTGGVFSASTVSKSSRIWNAQMARVPSSALQEGCDIEHLRGVLNETADWVQPEAGELYWMTDSTPHESLILKAGTYRQYFRLVVGKVAVWWEKHSTKNPLGILPDCPILTHSKFGDVEPPVKRCKLEHSGSQ